MKIKTREMPYEQVMNLPKQPHLKPKKPNIFFRSVMRLAGIPDLMSVGFTYDTRDMERAGEGPWLILMNHSSFIDLELSSRILYPKPYCIVCTSDGFVGKDGLMRNLGCIPTEKFVSDITLIKDMIYAIKKLNTSVLMYPEASYTFDGTATPLPSGLGALAKKLGVPVVMIKTNGAFLRDPLYNCLQKRNVKVSATMYCLADKNDLEKKSAEEIDLILKEAFTFDNFRDQKDNCIRVTEPFRADGLERILYKCPDCGKEGLTKGKGTGFSCSGCGAKYTLDELGCLVKENGDAKFHHIPDWYSWERESVRRELEEGTYLLDTDVSIGVMVDHKALYMVGKGHLTHSNDGFHLTGCDGKLNYSQKPLASYSLYSDYYWYEIDDVICIGTKDCLYYCFPEKKGVVAKTRLAAEELYKLKDPKNR